jgi:hypothetical protein
LGHCQEGTKKERKINNYMLHLNYGGVYVISSSKVKHNL